MAGNGPSRQGSHADIGLQESLAYCYMKVEHVPGEFVSNIFLREKREKVKYRMILNLKHLNKYVDKIHFRHVTNNFGIDYTRVYFHEF